MFDLPEQILQIHHPKPKSPDYSVQNARELSASSPDSYSHRNPLNSGLFSIRTLKSSCGGGTPKVGFSYDIFGSFHSFPSASFMSNAINSVTTIDMISVNAKKRPGHKKYPPPKGLTAALSSFPPVEGTRNRRGLNVSTSDPQIPVS